MRDDDDDCDRDGETYAGLEEGELRGLLYRRDEIISSLSARVRRLEAELEAARRG